MTAPIARAGLLAGLAALAALASCGRTSAGQDAAAGAGASAAAAAAIAAAATPAAPLRIAAGHPRVYLGDAAVKARLADGLRRHSGAAERFSDQVTGQLTGKQNYAFQPWYAALMFQLTGDRRYADWAVAETDKFVSAEEAKIAFDQRAAVASDSYLEVGQIVGNLALVYDWCHEQLTPAQRSRWITYANQAVWNVWNPKQARWGNAVHAWTGWSVDNPSNNYYYSFLRATMLLGLATRDENPRAQEWLDQFRTAKIGRQLVPQFARELQGGGSREGTGYGTAMKGLWQLYDWWEHSTGERIATLTPHALDSMAHLIHSIVPTLDRLAPIGDHARDSSAALFDYHREYLLELIALFPDEPLSARAAWLLGNSSVRRMQSGFMFPADFLYDLPPIQAKPLDDLSTTYWGSGTGQLMMRSDWTARATYADFSCGPYTESHAHRDQGSFVLYRNGWLATDSNMYSRSGIEQDEALHNLVRFEGASGVIRQRPGNACTLGALADTPHYTWASADMSAVYARGAGVTRVQREFLYLKPDTFVVFDRAVATSAGTRRIWTLNLPGEPKVDGETLRYGDGGSQLEVRRLAPTGLVPQISAWSTLKEGFRGGVRVDVADTAGTTSAFLHVLSTGGTVAEATRSDIAGQTGVAIRFKDGRTAVARFANEGRGGTLELRGPDGAVVATGPLPAEVKAPPLFARGP